MAESDKVEEIAREFVKADDLMVMYCDFAAITSTESEVTLSLYDTVLLQGGSAETRLRVCAKLSTQRALQIGQILTKQVTALKEHLISISEEESTRDTPAATETDAPSTQ